MLSRLASLSKNTPATETQAMNVNPMATVAGRTMTAELRECLEQS